MLFFQSINSCCAINGVQRRRREWRRKANVDYASPTHRQCYALHTPPMKLSTATAANSQSAVNVNSWNPHSYSKSCKITANAVISMMRLTPNGHCCFGSMFNAGAIVLAGSNGIKRRRQEQ